MNNKLKPKKSSLGWIPVGWESKRLEQICLQPISGFSANSFDDFVTPGGDDFGVLKLSCISEVFNPWENKKVIKEDMGKLNVSVRKDTMLISRANTEELVGAVCYVSENYSNLFLSDLMWEVSASSDSKINMKWLVYLLSTKYYRKTISSIANGTNASMKKITKSSFLNIQASVPPLSEQIKIAQILSTWDKAITQTQRLIEAKKRHKQGLMQQLLTGQMRFKEFGAPVAQAGNIPEGWICLKLGDCFSERSEFDSDLPLLSITSTKGVIPRDEIDRKDNSNEDKSKYRKILPGDIGYNTMRMWQGVSAVSTLKGIVSPAYTICKPKNGMYSPYFGYLFKLVVPWKS